MNLPPASHNPAGFGRYVRISRRLGVHNLAKTPDPHMMSWGFGGYGGWYEHSHYGLEPKRRGI